MLIDGPSLQLWHSRLVERMKDRQICESIAIFYSNLSLDRHTSIALRFYKWLDFKFCSRLAKFRNPFETVHVPQEIKWKNIELVLPNDMNINLLIDLRNSKGPFASVPSSCTVWRLDLGGPDAGLLEMVNGVDVTESKLKYVDRTGERLLYSARGATNRFSLYIGQARRCWGWVSRLPKLVERFLDTVPNDTKMNSQLRHPNESMIVSLMMKLLFRLSEKALYGLLGRDIWRIGLRKADGPDLPDNRRFQPVSTPQDCYLADPFLFQRNDRTYLFHELYRIYENKGEIAVSEVRNDGQIGPSKTIVRRSYHLSYPCLIESSGDLWMVPESKLGGSVDLYCCTKFPYTWEFAHSILPGVKAVDSTLFEYEGRLWLFTSPVDPSTGIADDLELYWADQLSGPWYAHPENPLFSDLRRGRCAGAVFKIAGALIRPAQDCAERYGRRIVFNRIECLTIDKYQEQEIGELKGDWGAGIKGAHTWNRSRDWEVVDGAFWQPKWC